MVKMGWWEVWRSCLPPLGLFGEDGPQEPGVIRGYTEDEDLLSFLLRDRFLALFDPAWR
jgi:hypothetical protein